MTTISLYLVVALLTIVHFYIFKTIKYKKHTAANENLASENLRNDKDKIFLYQADISFGMQEAQLVWSRYTGFIVLNGFLVTTATQLFFNQTAYSTPLIIIGIFGLALNSAWHIINCSGWSNQYVWLHYATKHLAYDNLSSLMQFFSKTSNLKKFGWIYTFAQTVPIISFVFSSISFAYGLKIITSTINSVIITTTVATLCIRIIYAVEKYEILKLGVEEWDRRHV